MEKQFEEKINLHEKLNIKEDKTFSMLGNLKVVTFIGLVVLFFLNKERSVFLYVLTFIVFVGLIALFVIQNRVGLKINYHKTIIDINKNYIKRIKGQWLDFEDDGKEFLDKKHKYGYDLDIVGRKSLFQMINISNTYLGRNRFANKLLNIDTDKEKVLLNQGATAELGKNIDFAQSFEYISSQINDDKKIMDIISFLEDKTPFFSNKLFNNIVHFLPVITVLLIAFELIFKPGLFITISALMVAGQMVLWGIGFAKVNSYLSDIGHYSLKFNKYKDLFDLIQETEFTSPKLKNIKQSLFNDISATKAMSELSSLNQKISLRHNFIIYFLLNVLLLWDYECCFALEKWRHNYGDYVAKWFNDVAEIESLLSFSVLENIIPKTSYPAIVDDMDINSINLGHPLINNENRIYNDLSLKDQIMIVSGSNMSGKTTFLRTIGINLVLSYNGSVICGDSLSTPIVDIVTSMRIADDLGEGISTFYAELLKIKTIINRSKQDSKMIFLIDEIFRGTNSKDRLFGAKTVIEDLNTRKVLGLITTHDLEIAELDAHDRIVNYHFREEYIKDKINFDYKLRKGVSKTTNGVELMKLIGITV